ncbi:uncharacterized protein LOC143301098 [Babylonia areolata]|uniref:uncharacterized protein LOC143301098 n=1 Tax=Babylonia areolata TaxID=304850 RepID=UPI003FD5D1AF
MATASPQDVPGERECSICHELLTVPKLLPCGHHLCRHCLVSWIQTKADAPCPLCRCAIVHSKEQEGGAAKAEAIADGFPTDLFMEKLVEAERLLSKDHHCCVCEDVAATALCLECGDMLCSSCEKGHRKLSMSKNHAVEYLASLTAETLASKRPCVCAAHPQETCRLYCSSHATPVCWLCASTKHRACSDLIELHDKAEEAGKSLEALVDKLDLGEAEIDRVLASLDQHWEKTDAYAATAISEIEEIRHGLERSVRTWEQGLKEETRRETEYIKAAVQEAKEHLLRRRGKLRTHKGVIRQGQGMENREVVDKMITALETRVEELDQIDVLPREALVLSDLELTLDKAAVSRFEQELSSFGQVQVAPADNFSNVTPTVLRFHENHGQAVRLGNFQQTATKTGLHCNHGIVLAQDPLKTDFLYEVQIVYQHVTVSKRRHKLETLAVGVVTVDPTTILLPDKSADLHSAFVLNRNWLKTPNCDEAVVLYSTAPLNCLRGGDRVGVSLDSDNRLHLHVNGQERGVLAEGIPRPCYPLFDMCGKVGQITALPVTKVMKTN